MSLLKRLEALEARQRTPGQTILHSAPGPAPLGAVRLTWGYAPQHVSEPDDDLASSDPAELPTVCAADIAPDEPDKPAAATPTPTPPAADPPPRFAVAGPLGGPGWRGPW